MSSARSLRFGSLLAGVAALGAIVGVVLAVASAHAGAAGLLAPAAVVVLPVLLANSELLLLTILSACVLVEFNDTLFPSLDQALYGSVIKGLTIVDLLVLGLTLAVLLDCHRRRQRPRGAGGLSFALLLLTFALIGGVVTGHYGGASSREIFEPMLKVSHVILLPLLVVNMSRTSASWKRFLELIVVLIAIKSLLGVYLAQTSAQAPVEGHALSYLEPTVNWLTLVYVLAVLGALMQKVRLPALAYVIAPFALASLLLSYRRSFWIAAVLGIAIVVVIAAGPRGRRIVVPALALLGTFTILLLSSVGGASSTSSNPILARAASLNPTKVTTNVEDRYRLDERRNVLANLRRQPITGLGIAVPWTVQYPMSTEHEGGRLYTHMIVLWYWLNLGLLGLIAYVALMASILWMSFAVWRRHPEPLIRVLGLAMLGGVAGLMAAETTGSFTGVDVRFSIVFPVVLGFLAVAWNEARAERLRSLMPAPARPGS